MAGVVALPFLLKPPSGAQDWRPGDPVLVVVSPHNEAIRQEFGRAFSEWHARRYGTPVRIDWRNIGGTTEIMRYLESEMVASFRSWWRMQGRPWPEGGGAMVLDTRFRPDAPPGHSASPQDRARWEVQKALHQAFRSVDNPRAFGCKIDLFFGGGSYDHGRAAAAGLIVPPWSPGEKPEELFIGPEGKTLIPEGESGEVWRTRTFFGTCLSTFGICFNRDRLRDLGIARPPQDWEDLTDPAYFGQLGVADPTKSGSISKAFEMIVQAQCHRAVSEAGFSDEEVDLFEQRIAQAGLPPGEMPEGVPMAYQHAVEAGWVRGLRILQRIGANARYFTDSASAVPVDVSMGNAAAGIAIDFYGRYQAETSRRADGTTPMGFVTPPAGSSVSADPISLLRGAQHRDLAVRFITFVLSVEGQKLWCYRPGTPGGPRKFALQRLPIRRDFYPPAPSADFHQTHSALPLGDPSVSPYVLASHFRYRPRWSGRHFNILRDIVRCMCLDSGEELRAAWAAIISRGGPARCPRAMAALERFPAEPEPLSWTSTLKVPDRDPIQKQKYLRAWTLAFRRNYREALQWAQTEGSGKP